MATTSKSLLALTISGALASSMAQAQLEEVIVTAQKREESVQDVSIAISAFDNSQLSEMGMTNLEEQWTGHIGLDCNR